MYNMQKIVDNIDEGIKRGKEKARLNSVLNDLLDCPFCGGKAELRPGELKPTIEEAITSEKNARCSAPKCLARFVVCTVTEWNTRPI